MNSEQIEAATPEQQREWLGYCDDCNGPITARSWAYLAVSWIAYWIVLALPCWRICWKPTLWLLPRAGDIAYGCTCSDKIAAAIARREAGE